jgi:hypothetical protein
MRFPIKYGAALAGKHQGAANFALKKIPNTKTGLPDTFAPRIE